MRPTILAALVAVTLSGVACTRRDPPSDLVAIGGLESAAQLVPCVGSEARFKVLSGWDEILLSDATPGVEVGYATDEDGPVIPVVGGGVSDLGGPFWIVITFIDPAATVGEVTLEVRNVGGHLPNRAGRARLRAARDCVPPPPPPPPSSSTTVHGSCAAAPEAPTPTPPEIRFKGRTSTVGVAGAGYCVQDVATGQALATLLDPGAAPTYGAAWLRGEVPAQAQPTVQWSIVVFGAGGIAVSGFVSETEEFGIVGFGYANQNMTDGVADDANDPTLVTLTSHSGRFISFFAPDATTGFPTARPEVVAVAGPARPVTALRLFLDGGVVYATDAGELLYKADPAQAGDATLLGAFAIDARRLRAAGGLLFLSDFGGARVAVFHWDGRSPPRFLTHVPVGNSPIGIDARVRGDGSVALASTGFHENTYSVTAFDAAGTVLSNVKTRLPEGCLAPGHAAWRSDDQLDVTCNGSGQVVHVDLGAE